MAELAYSFHIGSDKNRKNISKTNAKSNVSGTTSLSNNAIQNAKQLSRVDKHNYRKYDNNQELIEVVKGTNSLYNDIKNLYKNEFDEARILYNNNQTRDDRKIDDYFKKISENSKNDLACEIIIELGDKEYWDTKDNNFKKKMSNVYKEQINDLESILPNFKIASAIIHYDETSPHLHIVGVPIKYKNKNGMSKQVGKSDVFTKQKLMELQDKMRTLCIASFNKEYELNNTLKTKQKGRNKDINVKDMTNYQVMKNELEKNKENIKVVSKKSIKLDNNSLIIKDTINNLKTNTFKKNNYTITEEDKDNILNYIDKVNETNKDFKKLELLSTTLNNVDNELKENKEKIKILSENNKALSLKVDTLSTNLENKNNEIKELKNENIKLKTLVNRFETIFKRLVNFIKNKINKTKDNDKYIELSNELYSYGIFSEKTVKDIKKSKEKNNLSI